MSLIQEALKRQQEEMRGKVEQAPPIQAPEPAKPITKLQRKGAQPVVPPPVQDIPPVQEPPVSGTAAVPPPVPQELLGENSPAEAESTTQPPQAETAAKGASLKKPIMVIILSAVVIVGLIAAAAWGVMKFFASGSEPVPETPVAVVPEPVQPPVAPVTPEPVQPGTELVGIAIQDKPAPVVPPPTPVEPPPEPEPEIIEWPFLTVDGLVGRGDQGSAMINKQIINVGEVVEGVRITGIGIQGVYMEYRGEKKFVKVNSSTR